MKADGRSIPNHALGSYGTCSRIVLLAVLQTSYLTPPLAPSIFYLRAITPPEITLKHMYRGVVPFIVIQLIVLAVVLFYEPAVLWLPGITSGPSW